MAESSRSTPVDLLCVEEDRHRVRLLREALELRGLAVRLRKPGARANAPLALVVITSHGPDEQSLNQYRARYQRLLRVTFEPGVTIGDADTIVLAGWPGRRSDRALAGLVRRLEADHQLRRATPADRASAPGQPGTGTSAAADPHPAWALVPIVIIGIVIALVWPEQQQTVTELPAEAAARTEVGSGAGTDAGRTGGTGIPVASAAGANASADASASGAAEHPGEDAGAAAAGPQLAPPAAGSMQASPLVATAALPANATIARFCRARHPAAARAWLAAFSWRDVRQARRSPCVGQLLERPGFQWLGAALARIERPTTAAAD